MNEDQYWPKIATVLLSLGRGTIATISPEAEGDEAYAGCSITGFVGIFLIISLFLNTTTQIPSQIIKIRIKPCTDIIVITPGRPEKAYKDAVASISIPTTANNTTWINNKIAPANNRHFALVIFPTLLPRMHIITEIMVTTKITIAIML